MYEKELTLLFKSSCFNEKTKSMEVDRVYILGQQALSYCLAFVHSWMKSSVRCVLLCPNDPKTGFNPFGKAAKRG